MARHHGREAQRRRALRCEQLEDRRMLATITVDTLVDAIDFNDGKTSLREAIFAANTVPGADEIIFHPALFANGPAESRLDLGELVVTDTTSLVGPGRSRLTIDAQLQSRIFNFNTTSTCAFSGLTVTRGSSQAPGGAVYALGQLIINDVSIEDSRADGGDSSHGGGLWAPTVSIRKSVVMNNISGGLGGGIFANVLEMQNCIVSGNESSREGGTRGGGGINAYSATISGTVITGNRAAKNGGGIAAQNLTLVNSTVSSNSSPKGEGGGIHARYAEIEDSQIASNLAGQGGGIRALNSLRLNASTVLGNRSAGVGLGRGGGVFASEDLHITNSGILANSALGPGGGVYVDGTIDLADSIVSGNSTSGPGSSGGGIHTGNSSRVVIQRSLMSGNYTSGEVAFGGGVYARQAEIVDATITGNFTTGASASGGGVAGDRISITRSIISDNHVDNRASAGGLYVRQATVAQTTISGNTASGSGGGAVVRSITATHVTVSGNTATGGGGIVINGFNSQFIFCTVTDNHASYAGLGAGGGGIWTTTESNGVLLQNSIVAGNHRGPGISDDVRGSVAQLWTMIGVGAGSLGPLADNGGPTLPGGYKLLTHAPLAGSPLIDAGDPAIVPDVGGVPEFDQRGAPYTRLAGSRVDIGAVESQAVGGALSGDFNLDGRVDGSDFLAWQRGVGRTGVVTIRHGDATADGDVDANDLAVWKARAAAEGFRSQGSGVSETNVTWQTAAVADAVFAAGDFSQLLASSHAPTSVRGKWRPPRRG